MAVPRAFLVAFSVAMYCTLYSGPIDVALFFITSTIPVSSLPLEQVFAELLGYLPSEEVATGILSFLFFTFIIIQLLREKWARNGTSRWEGPGKVLLFPCRTWHVRMRPRLHFFSYPYLTVGIPVGFEGNSGGLVSVGCQDKQGFSTWLLSWLSLCPRLTKGWFTVDASDYLERGGSKLGLRGKLNQYLRQQVSCSLLPAWPMVLNSNFIRGSIRQPTRTPIWSPLPVSSATISTPFRSGTFTMSTGT